MKLNKIFTLSFYLIVIIFNYGYSYNSFVKERINLTIQSERYHVIVASFKTESLAQKELVRLNNSGYELAKILFDQNGKNFRISIMSFDNRSSAINYSKEINQSGFNDTWIFYNSLNQSSPNPIVKTGVTPPLNLQSNSTSKDILPVSQSQDEGDPEYHILVGSFNNQNYANNFKESLLRQGYLKAKVIKEGAEETYNVIINTFKSKVGADKFIQTLSDTPYRNATIPGYPSKKLSKVILPRPIPNQSISEQIVSKEPINRNSVKQSKEEQTQTKDKIEEGEANNIDSEKPTTEPITEPVILNKPVNTSSVEQNKEEQANIIDEIKDEGVNNVAYEKSIVEPKM